MADTAGLAEEPHLLNLKVMRLSAPPLARHQAPFFLDPDPASAQNELLSSFRTALSRKESSDPASIASLESTSSSPQQTARDLPLSPMLSLPASFGTISLGETFTAILSLSNDSPYPVASPRLLAEMQSNTQKAVLGEKVGQPRRTSTSTAGRDDAQPTRGKGILDPGRSLDLKVGYEMKEMGMNVLVVSVKYESSTGPREYVKYYKFNVTAPLAIKTKVHLPMSPSALLDLHEREKVYLEIHIQNVSPSTLVFEKVELQTVPGLTWLRGAEEVSQTEGVATSGDKRKINATDPLCPGNSKQYLFCLTPSPRVDFPATSLFPPFYNPGTVLPLGRLDLVWRAGFGEKGHLLTAMLNRRAPQPGLFASSIRAPAGQGGSARILENGLARPALLSASSGMPPPLPPKSGATGEETYEVDLAVLECNRKSAITFEAMTAKLRLAIGSVGPYREPGEQVLHLAIQYLTEQQRSEEGGPHPTIRAPIDASGTSSPLMLSQRPSAIDLRAQAVVPLRPGSPRPNSSMDHSAGQPPGPPASPARLTSRALPMASATTATPAQDDYEAEEVVFPPPPILQNSSSFPINLDHAIGAIGQLGSSLLILPSVTIRPLARPSGQRDESPRSSIDGERVPPPPLPAADKRKEGFAEFEIELMPEREGLAQTGGLRVLLLNDREDCSKGGRTLGEWATLGEISIIG